MRICNSFESVVYSILDSTNLAFAQYIVDQTQTSTCKHVDCFFFFMSMLNANIANQHIPHGQVVTTVCQLLTGSN